MILGDDNNDDVAGDDEDNDDDFDENDGDDKERYCVQREESPPQPELLDKQSIFAITIMQKPCHCEYVTFLCWKYIFEDMCYNCDQIMVNIQMINFLR